MPRGPALIARTSPPPANATRPAPLPLPPTPASPARALLVDPDPVSDSAPALQMLRQNGVAISHVASAEAARSAVATEGFHLVILELDAEAYDGASLCSELTAVGLPVMAWSHRDAPLDQVVAFELGVDEFVSKKAHPLEMVARARAALKRRSAAPRAAAPDLEGWRFEVRAESLTSSTGHRIWLSRSTCGLLAFFCEHPCHKLRRADLLPAVSPDGKPLARRTIDVMVSRLRKTMDSCDDAGQLIRTVRPDGYVFDAVVQRTTTGFQFQGVADADAPAPAH